MSATENKKLLAEELAKPRNAGTSKAIADKIDGCTILDPHPVAPKHAAGWNDAIEMVKLSIEPNLKNLELAEATPPSESVLDSLEAEVTKMLTESMEQDYQTLTAEDRWVNEGAIAAFKAVLTLVATAKQRASKESGAR